MPDMTLRISTQEAWVIAEALSLVSGYDTSLLEQRVRAARARALQHRIDDRSMFTCGWCHERIFSKEMGPHITKCKKDYQEMIARMPDRLKELAEGDLYG